MAPMVPLPTPPHPQRLWLRACTLPRGVPLAAVAAMAKVAGVVGLMGVVAMVQAPRTALAQISPNCLLNGKPLACAITPGPEGPAGPNGAPGAVSLTVMYADGQAFRLSHLPSSCRQKDPLTLCPATITPRNGFGTPLRGRYLGTRYEGGYRHEYQAGKLAIQYVFVD